MTQEELDIDDRPEWFEEQDEGTDGDDEPFDPEGADWFDDVEVVDPEAEAVRETEPDAAGDEPPAGEAAESTDGEPAEPTAAESTPEASVDAAETTAEADEALVAESSEASAGAFESAEPEPVATDADDGERDETETTAAASNVTSDEESAEDELDEESAEDELDEEVSEEALDEEVGVEGGESQVDDEEIDGVTEPTAEPGDVEPSARESGATETEGVARVDEETESVDASSTADRASDETDAEAGSSSSGIGRIVAWMKSLVGLR